jgi:hypothetical protein
MGHISGIYGRPRFNICNVREFSDLPMCNGGRDMYDEATPGYWESK